MGLEEEKRVNTSGIRKNIFKSPWVGLNAACEVEGGSVHHGNPRRGAEGIQVVAGDFRPPGWQADAQRMSGSV